MLNDNKILEDVSNQIQKKTSSYIFVRTKIRIFKIANRLQQFFIEDIVKPDISNG